MSPRRNRRSGVRDGQMPGMPGVPGHAPAGPFRGVPGQIPGQSPYAAQISPFPQLAQIKAQQRAFRAQMPGPPGQAGQQSQAQPPAQMPGRTPGLGNLPGIPGQLPGQMPAMPNQTPGLMPRRPGPWPLPQIQPNAAGGMNLPNKPGHKCMGPLPVLHQMRRQRHDPPRAQGGYNYQGSGGYMRPRTEADGPYRGAFGGAREGGQRGRR